ncbi:DUF397 domain-containing protein [Streptomyces kaniharaensis]|uniref:DUF397 domain-containing protein n=1 Tax=Streptomyces kaniharaensis TaxID=212423 RepID=A0A6N7L5Z9_9ACTN|nr:DUF397 domain-containing protein [Streptomyces kaniharaensis]MQS17894.1 DUF397 domain-containing protein [Streptomyces kaniharaensis]
MTHHITAPELAGVADWFKSSYSGGSGNNCVEVADLTATRFEAVAIRDSKDPAGPALLVTPEAFAGLVAFARNFGV